MNALQTYIKRFDDDKDKQLAIKMNDIISEVLPDAEVRISYDLVGYFQPKQICFFGIQSKHIGFYPTNKPIAEFADEIQSYLSGKTTLRFPKNEDKIPVDLIQRIAVYNLNN
ncbi:iron chaperone [Companilactobacillus mishanensis]|uniref:YdhG-like domain-containing protein n=1 Tax=Companilactobacillus mishanensis TaxID=2486008 RepID=A0A5P0ZKJ1_9LACO|nr:DUF1801 domain-containing protein [Companilactobacillus mishanensis]MQS53562.1 hypothetical protein [Companilactobacillus mishanensis]